MSQSNEITQDAFLVKGRQVVDQSSVIEEVAQETAQDNTIPADYQAVKYCTQGKLLTPPVLHFRNYRLEETAELAMLTEDNEYEIFTSILNRMVWEDFDCRDMTQEEIIQTLLTIWARWWNPFIEVQKYFVNPDLEGDALRAKDNISIARVKISDLNFDDLEAPEFHTPFTVTTPEGDKYSVRFPIIRDIIFTKKYISKKYAQEDSHFHAVAKRIDSGEATPDEADEFMDYVRVKAKEGLIVERAQLLVAKNGEELSPVEKVECARNLDMHFWEFVSNQQSKYKYGLQTDEVPFTCTVTGKPIRRELRQLQPSDFIPSVRSEHDSGYSISFE